jgi:hypothetical protein
MNNDVMSSVHELNEALNDMMRRFNDAIEQLAESLRKIFQEYIHNEEEAKVISNQKDRRIFAFGEKSIHDKKPNTRPLGRSTLMVRCRNSC